jgi:glycerol-3-phosphate O-acyltransferase
MQFEEIKSYADRGDLPPAIAETLDKFCCSYRDAVEKSGKSFEGCRSILTTFVKLVVEELKNPSTFEPFHQQVRAPFDYYQFGLDIIRPLIAFDKSSVSNLPILEVIKKQLANKENVVFFANHQTEPDPQIINLMLEKDYSDLARGMIFLAGHRVITDPLAVPLVKGAIYCVFSLKSTLRPLQSRKRRNRFIIKRP